MLSVSIFLLLILLLINLPVVHTFLTNRTNSVLKANGFPITVGKISISIKGEIELTEIEIITEAHDTIVTAGSIQVSFRILPLFSKQIIINSLVLENVNANLITDSTGTMNLLTIFSSPSTQEPDVNTTPSSWEIKVNEAHIINVNFSYSDIQAKIFYKQILTSADVTFDTFSLLQKQIDVSSIKIANGNGIISIANHESDTIKTSDTPSAWKFTVGDVNLQNMAFDYVDLSTNDSLFTSIKRAGMRVDKLDLGSNEIFVSNFTLEEPKIKLISSMAQPVTTETDSSEMNYPFQFPYRIVCNEMSIKNGSFELSNNQLALSDSTIQWFPVQNINTSIKDIHINAKKSGCTMTHLSLNLNRVVEIKSGELTLDNDSLLNGKLQLELIAITGPRPTSYFATNDTLSIAANLNGSINKLNIQSLNVTAFSGIELNVTGSIQHIQKLEETACDLQIKTNSINDKQLKGLVAVYSPDLQLRSLNNLQISGTVRNKFTNPEFNLSLNSNSGFLNIQGNYNSETNFSTLQAALKDVQLRQMLGEDFPQNVTAKLNWSGKLGSLDELQGKGQLAIENLKYKDLVTKDFNLTFDIANNLCNYTIFALDSTISCDLAGSIGWNKSTYQGQVEGRFMFHEGKSKILQGDVSAQSNIAFSFLYSPSNTEASLSLKNITLTKDDKITSIENVSFNLEMGKETIKLKLTSDFINSEFNCQSDYTQFASAIKSIELQNIFRLDSAEILNAKGISGLPEFEFTTIAKYDSIINFFIPDTTFSFSNINLSIGKSVGENDIHTNLTADTIQYEKYQAFGTKLNLIADQSVLHGNLSIDSSYVNNIWGGPANLKLDVSSDKISSSLLISDTSKTPTYQIGMEALKGHDRVLFKSTAPEWIINSDKWSFVSNDFLTYEIATDNYIANLDLHRDSMVIEMRGSKSDSITLHLKDIVISKLISSKLMTEVPDAVVNANLVYREKDKQYVDFNFSLREGKWKDIVIDHIESTGQMSMDSSGIIQSELIAQLNDTSLLKISTAPDNDISKQVISANFNHLPVKILEPFAKEYVNNLDGYASGHIHISEDGNQPVLNGKIRMEAITLNIVPLQAYFTITDDTIIIKENQIYFNRFAVLDSLQKKLFVNGTLDLTDSENIIADLNVNLDDIRVMNTTVKDDPDFYGSVIVNSGLSITGPVTKPSIKGNIILQQGTNITYRQVNDISVQETQKVVTFAELSDDSIRHAMPLSKIRDISGMPFIQTTIEVNPKSKFNFIISSGYDIHIGIAGNGLLNYSMLPNNTMSLTGRYEINQGTADLKFTGWPLKYFTITPGSSLRWDGDIGDPEINLEATSKVKGSYINPVDNKTRYVEFIVSMKLLNQLSKLAIVFNVKSQDQYITSVLNALSEDELMKQAVNLLIFESINLPNMSSSSNYLDSQINSFWESQLNSLTKTSFKKIDLSFGVDSYTQTTSGGAEQDKTSLSYEMERKFFRDRASVKISGRFNDNSQTGNQTNSMIENFIFEYELDSLERKFLKLYTRKDYEDILDGEVTKSGVGFIYRKSYPYFRSIWYRKPKTAPLQKPEESKSN
ncbi:MAG TPA: translocation/assembly module TamB domain-containing protein [Bacteroidia bacterium]|nr:translocation/assembly module TamB domain-containing protein [Bacteroidia bacterium]